MTDAKTLFERFVREHATNLLRTSFLLTGDRASAEDLLQETLTKLYPKWSRVLAAEAPVAYVRRCLTNEFLGARRRRTITLVGYVTDEQPDYLPDVGDEIANRDTTMRMLRALSERQRAAIVLRYFHDMDDAEIAELLSCRQATVRSLVSRGLLAMRTADALVPSAIGPTTEERK